MSVWEWLGLAKADAVDHGNRLEQIERTLSDLGAGRARHLACFAYILTRPARADHQVTDDEAAQMQLIIAEHAKVTAVQAHAIVEVAREAARQSGGTEDFIITREFERTATREEKLHLLHCLFLIGAADESILTVEDNEIRRVASELKLEHADYITIRRDHLKHLEVLRKNPS